MKRRGGVAFSAALAVVLVFGGLFPSTLELASGEEAESASGDGSGSDMVGEASASVTIQVEGSSDAAGLSAESLEHRMPTLEEYLKQATGGNEPAALSADDGGEEATAAQLAEVYAASDLKPGTPAYYDARWNDAIDKVKKTGVGGASVWADTSAKGNEGGALAPWDGNLAGVKPAQGEGTTGNPYKVYTANELRYALVNKASCQLMQDIDLGGAQGINWAAVSIDTAVVIDGNGYTIWNMFSYSDATEGNEPVGFLGTISSPDFVLKNLTMSNCKCESANQTQPGRMATMIACLQAGTVEGCGLENSLVGPRNENGSLSLYGIGGMLDSAGWPSTGKIFIRNSYTKNVHARGTGCVANFYEGGWTRGTADTSTITIENSAAMDGSIVTNSGHSGGFISCTGQTVVTNCFSNLDCYGYDQTGVFCGVIHNNVQIKDSWASGKVEGVRNSGGFVSGLGAHDAIDSTFENCYSTSMVGMSSSAAVMGGFVGSTESYSGTTPKLHFTNCYAAGEVGTLKSLPDGTAVNDDGTPVSDVGGFAGVSTTAVYNACYYDKQTTGSAEKAIANQPDNRVTGLLTKSLSTLNIGSDWSLSNDGSTYPQLSVFTTGTWGGSAKLGELARAYSQASVSTVFLYPCNEATFDAAATDYDTVRKIRYAFPLTNNASVNNSSIKTSWVYDPDNSAYYPNDSPLNPGTKIITLSAAQGEPAMDDVSVTAVASGIGWLRVYTDYDGVVGTRNLRLVPTTSVAIGTDNKAIVGSDATVYAQATSADPQYKPLEETLTRFDHRDGIKFIVATSVNLQAFMDDPKPVGDGGYASLEEKMAAHDIGCTDFADPNLNAAVSVDNKTNLDYVVRLQNAGGGTLEQVVRLSVCKVIPSTVEGQPPTYSFPLEWTDSLKNLFTKQRSAELSETGTYLLSYSWMDPTKTSTQAEGTKYLTVVPPLSLSYHLGYVPSGSSDDLYTKDPGAYQNTQTITERAQLYPETAKLPAAPTRYGYDFSGWVYNRDTSISFDADTPITAVTDALGNTETNISILATWSAHPQNIVIKDGKNGTVKETITSAFDRGVLAELDGKESLFSDQVVAGKSEFLGWRIESGLGDARIGTYVSATDTVPDNEVVVYPSFGTVVSANISAYNETQGDIGGHVTNRVGDLITYTISIKNSSPGLKWKNAKILDELPKGIDVVPDSIQLAKAGEDPQPLPNSVYNEAEGENGSIIHTMDVTLDTDDEYLLSFQVKINDDAPYVSSGAGAGILNSATVDGTDEDGNEVAATTDEAKLPGSGYVAFTPADKWVSKDAANLTDPGAPSAQVGDIIKYTVELGNKSDDPNSRWENAWFYDKVPAGLVVDPSSITMTHPLEDGTEGMHEHIVPTGYNKATGEISVSAGVLKAGEKATLTFDVIVSPDAVGQSIKNTAWAVTDGKDNPTDPPDNPGDVTDPPKPNPDNPDPDSPDPDPTDPVGPGGEGKAQLSVAKSTNVTEASPGSIIPYTITVSNAGDAHAKDVVITDALPEGLAYVSSVPAAQVNGQNVSWTLTVPAGMSVTRTVMARVTGTAGTTIANSVTVTDPADPDNPVTPPVDPPIEVVPGADAPDVHIAKTASADTALTGSQLTYAIFVSNSGAADATGVAVTDQLPAGTLFMSASDGGTYRNGVCAWTVDVPAGQTKQLNLTVKVQAKTGTLVNMATSVHAGKADVSEPVQTTVSQKPIVEDKPQLSVTKTTDATSVAQGSEIPYTITVTNSGKGDATGIDIVDALPAGLEYVSSSPAATTVEGNTVTWTVDIASGQTIVRTIVARVTGDVGASIENGVSVTNPDGGDPIAPPDNPTVDVTDPEDAKETVDLSISKASSVDAAKTGDQITYTVTVFNKGGKEAVDVTVTDALPAGLSFVSATEGATAANGTVSWTGTVGAQSSTSFAIVAEVAAKNATLVNTAVATHEGTQVTSDPTTVAVTSDTPTPDTKPELSVTKTTDVEGAAPGSLVPFTITVSNTGDGDAKGVAVVDNLPSGLEYVSSTPAATYDKATNAVSWTVDVAAGGQTVCVVTARVAEGATGSLENSVTVTDPNDSDNPVTPPDVPQVDVTDPDPGAKPSISLAKTASASTTVPGGQITYTLALTNTGTVDAEGVALTDALPAGSSFVMASDGGACENGMVSWTLDVAAGQQKEVTVTIDAPASSGSMMNTAQAVSGDTTVKSDTVTTTVKEEDAGDAGKPQLSVAKSTPVTQAQPGSVVPYTITVSNTGDADAIDVEVVDELPSGLEYVSSSPTGKVEGSKITWKVTVKVGESVVRMLNARVTATDGQSIANSVTVTDPNDPDNPIEPPEKPEITVPEEAKPSAVLSVDASTASTGDTVRYTLTVTNATKSDADGVKAVHRLPVGVSFQTASDGGVYAPDTAPAAPAAFGERAALADTREPAADVDNDAGTVTWTMDVPAGSSVTRVVSAKVTAQSGSLVSSADLIHNNKTIAVAPVSTTVLTDGSSTGTPKISVLKTTSATEAAPGAQIPYTITVRNTGDGDAANLKVTDTLPASLTYVSSSPAGVHDSGANTVTWTIDALAAGQSVTRTIVAQVADDATGTVANTVEVTDPAHPDEPVTPPIDPDTPIIDPDDEAKPLISISKTADKDAAENGDEVAYTVTVANTGTADANGVKVSDTLPQGLQFVEASDGGAFENGTAAWTVDVPAGATVTRTLKATVTAKAGTLTNVALASHAGTTASSESVSTTVTPGSAGPGTPELSVSKTTPVTQAAQGSEIPYLITVTNTGDGDALGYRIVDVLPEGLAYVSSTPAAAVNGQEVSWTADVLKGTSVTRTVVVRVTGAVGATIKNSVSVTDPDGGNEVVPPVDPPIDVTDPEKRADVHITKSAKTDKAPAGGRLVYSIMLTNTGDADANGVVVTDKLPMNTSFMDASDGGTYDTKTNKITWTVDVPAGATKEIKLGVRIEAATGTIVNVATQTYDGKSESTVPAVVSPVTTDVTEADPETTAEKTVRNVTAEAEGREGADDPTTWLDRDILEYTVVAANTNSTSLWREVVLSDVLPAGLELAEGEPVLYTAPGSVDGVQLDGAYDASARTLRVEVGDIGGGEQAKLVYRTQIIAGDDYSVDAHLRNRVQSAGYSPDGGTEIIEEALAPVPTPVPLSDKALSKQAVNLTDPADDVVQVGDRIRYTITAENREPNPRAAWDNAYIYDRIPAALDIDVATLTLVASDGSVHAVADCFDPASRELIVSVGRIVGGTSAVVTFEATIPERAVGEDIANVAMVGTLDPADPTVPANPGVPDPDTVPEPAEPDLDDSPVTPNPAPTDPVVPNGEGEVLLADPDPSVDKTVKDLAGDGSYDNGDEVLYTITVANARPGSAWYGVAVTDTVPLGLKLDAKSIRIAGPDKVFADVAPEAYNEGTRELSVFVGDVLGGETYTVVYTCTLDFSLGEGDVVNHVVVSGSDPGGVDEGVEGGASIVRPLIPWDSSALVRSGDANGNLVSLLALVVLMAGGLAASAGYLSRSRTRRRRA
ncbi:isopeptide-forming domain-containing fimbrial protein [Raoultibacter phocaeensis]|uniref:isopeptide-forming domain-containing fimbrial protein n=1 Tax=Raoultibacter phocaeensis TaxID=2479841 RepID=UPI0015D63FF0|nr:isopeptide-forming domain-containing fimbrial protein [Raoultibacter phocaeensis]